MRTMLKVLVSLGLVPHSCQLPSILTNLANGSITFKHVVQSLLALSRRFLDTEKPYVSFRLSCRHPVGRHPIEKSTRLKLKPTLSSHPPGPETHSTVRRRAVLSFPHRFLPSLRRKMLRTSGNTLWDGACTCSLSGSRALKQAKVRLLELTFCSLCLSLLLSTLETTIVSTSLVSIADALHRFDQSGWVVTSYLLTYTGAPSPFPL